MSLDFPSTHLFIHFVKDRFIGMFSFPTLKDLNLEVALVFILTFYCS